MEAPTTTLADSLLDDLDDLSDVENGDETVQAEDIDEEGNEVVVQHSENGDSSKGGDGSAALNHEDDNDLDRKPAHSAGNGKKRALLDDPRLQDHLETIRSLSSSSSEPATVPNNNNNSSSNMSEYYDLIVSSNRHLSNLSNEYHLAHSRLCTAYHPKFPELEDLIVDPHRYRSTVAILGNEMDITKKNEALNEILTSNQIITISVAGSTTSGRPLTIEEVRIVKEAGEYMDGVSAVQTELTTFVESRMEHLSPNVCAIVGPTIAARLLGLAGGLAELSKVPACNLQVMGQIRQSATSRAGMSALHSKPHTGIIAECELVRSCPTYMHKKVAKAVAAKVALAARCDYVNAMSGRVSSSAEAGNKFVGEIKKKIAKWDEPDNAPVVKALPKPDLKTKKRRGGKRIRRMKERFEETELMKQANKRAFSKETGEYGDDAMGLTMGLLDTKEGEGVGNVRQTTERKKMRHANTKASRKRAEQMGSAGTATSGLASSMAFTPVQGLELVNPNANKDRVREANMKWFSDNAGFQSALPKK